MDEFLSRYSDEAPIWSMIIIGGVFIVTAIWHERSWWTRRAWIKTVGLVVGYESQGSEVDLHPCIEFNHEEQTQIFVSNHSREPRLKVGDSVQVVYDPSSLEAEYLGYDSRFFPSVIMIVLGFVLLFFGLRRLDSIESSENQLRQSRIEKGNLS